MEKELELLTLAEIKEGLKTTTLRFVDSREVDEHGKPLRGTVYHGKEKLGLIQKGIFEYDLAKDQENIVAVKGYTKEGVALGWVFMIRRGVDL